MSVSPATFQLVGELVRRRAAIVLEPGKEYLVDARLAPLAKARKLEGADELVAYYRTLDNVNADALAREIVEALTTNETSFFRDVHPFATLKDTVIPALMRARASTTKLRIWCAAASTGQEPFSIAMLLHDAFPELATWDVKIFATDINRAVLERARSGVFRQLEVNRGLPATMLVKHFEQVGADWRLKPQISSMVTFAELNLLDRWPREKYDVVFMRNVLIYFDVPTKRQILGRVRESLADDGALFLGGAETTVNIDDALVAHRIDGASTVYRRKFELPASAASAARTTPSAV